MFVVVRGTNYDITVFRNCSVVKGVSEVATPPMARTVALRIIYLGQECFAERCIVLSQYVC